MEKLVKSSIQFRLQSKAISIIDPCWGNGWFRREHGKTETTTTPVENRLDTRPAALWRLSLITWTNRFVFLWWGFLRNSLAQPFIDEIRQPPAGRLDGCSSIRSTFRFPVGGLVWKKRNRFYFGGNGGLHAQLINWTHWNFGFGGLYSYSC